MNPELLTLVKQRDRDRYVWVLCLPAKHQKAALGLLAWNAEIALVAEITSEPITGAIRLKWWQDALEEIYGNQLVRQHAVAIALAEVIGQHQIPRGLCEQLITGRSCDLEVTKGFDHEAQFFAYLDDTAGALHGLLAWVCDAEAAQAHRSTIAAMAQIYGICGLLRATPYLAQAGMVRWPKDSLRLFGLGPEAIENGTETERFTQFITHWTLEALDRDLALAPLPVSLKPLVLLHHIALTYLHQLVRNHYQLSAVPVHLPSLPLRVWWKSVVG